LWIKSGINVDISDYQNNQIPGYFYGFQTCFEKKKQISTSNCLEPGSSLKFFHPPKLGALFDSTNFQIPGIDGSESGGYVIPPPHRPFPHISYYQGFFLFFFWANFLARIPSIN
jgi:hypothetical protein